MMYHNEAKPMNLNHNRSNSATMYYVYSTNNVALKDLLIHSRLKDVGFISL
uniref:Uncharacterized protein n=1 Tax=Amphimedon queenslandica TaxID=400682 RepID=A0A1X7URU2_AMPQE